MSTPRNTARNAPAQRRFWIASGDREWARQQALTLAAAVERAFWLGDERPAGIPGLPAGQVRQRLGQESDLLIIDAWSGFDPDAFAAICGTLRGGGLLLLLLPPLAYWPCLTDPYLARISPHPEAFRAGFIQRLAGLLQAQDWIHWLRPGQPLPTWTPPPTPTTTRLQLTDDQQLALEQLLRTARGRGRRPLLLMADRGRGKSTALGIAAARLLREDGRRVLVTAPQRAMVVTLFAEAARQLGLPTAPQGSIELGDASLRFVPPDELLRQRPSAELLLVDEAAAIPAPLLEALLGAYNRVVFATTVHGYEGTGRGFLLRFAARLDHIAPGWRQCRLETPVRWATGDRLEALLYQALLLNAEAPAATADSGEAGPVEVLSAQRLLTDESLLRQVYGLLYVGHYQTRPSDLRRLLDDPDMEGLMIRVGETPVAVLLSLREGGLDTELAEQVSLGRRRFRGHLLAQTLAAHAGFAEAASLHYRRIQRIAVLPAWQRRGLGLRLLRHLRNSARAEAVDAIGCSFGATAELLAFWHRAGLTPVRLGVSRDGASGQHALVMLDALSSPAQELLARLRQRFDEQLPCLLGDPLRDLEAAIALPLLALSGCPPVLNAQDLRDLHAFAQGARDYASARLALWRWTCRAVIAHPSPNQLAPLLLKVLQGHPWQDVAAQLGLPGQRQVMQAMRRVVADPPGCNAVSADRLAVQFFVDSGSIPATIRRRAGPPAID